MLITSELTNQSARKALFTCVVYTNNQNATTNKRTWDSCHDSPAIYIYLTIIPRARVGNEVIKSQRGAKRRVGYNHLIIIINNNVIFMAGLQCHAIKNKNHNHSMN